MTDNTRIEIPYQITLREPAIFSRIEGEPNSAVSADYVPGSVVRGAAIGAYIQKNGAFELTTDEVARGLFFTDNVRFLNAILCLEPKDGELMVGQVVPQTWRKPKDAEEQYTVYDGIRRSSVAEDTKRVGNAYGFGLQMRTNGETEIASGHIEKVKRILNVHSVRLRRGGTEQTVYRYDALAAGQTFEGVIRCESHEAASALFDLLGGERTLSIGGAASAGYGAAVLLIGEPMSVQQSAQAYTSERVILTLLSDTIIRDEYGQVQPTWDALAETLKSLAVSFSNPLEDMVNSREQNSTVLALPAGMVGGFNRKWGLPLPQTPALLQGSVIALNNVTMSADAADHLTWYGLGERLNEGFGRVAINWQGTPTIEISKFEPPEPETERPVLEGDMQTYWNKMEKRILEQRFERGYIGFAYQPDYKIHGEITKTQLAAIRAVIANELRKDSPSPEALKKYVSDAGEKAAGKFLQRATIHGRTLAEWLAEPDIPRLARLSKRLEEEEKITRQALLDLKFIDAVLLRAMNERKEDRD